MLSLASQKQKKHKYESFSKEKSLQKTKQNKQKKSLAKLFGQRVSPLLFLALIM